MPEENYDAYLEHQAKKARHPKYRGPLMKERKARLKWFQRQFRECGMRLDHNSEIVTLGARFGEEVEALHNLGFCKSFGIDLEDHPPYVIKADMNQFVREAADGSYDLVYTNSTDHCWDLQEFCTNLARISRKYVLLHVSLGMREFEMHDLDDSVADLIPAKLTEKMHFPDQPFGFAYRLLFAT